MLDWSRIDELRDEIGAGDFGDVVELFLQEVEEVISRLSTSPDHGQLEQDLHFLKGSALNLGFSSFSRLCQEGERLSGAGQTDLVNIAAIVEEYERSRDRFLAELAARYAA